MEFPVDITFKMLGWTAQIHLTDGSGRLIGYMPASPRTKGRLAIYADMSLGTPIYTINAENAFTQWFEDGASRRIGEFGILPTAQGKYISVGSEPRFQFVRESEWLEFVDRLVPSLPIVNGLTGLIIRPRVNAVRTQSGADVLRIVKKRKLVDICYSLQALDEIDGSEQECLVLSAVVVAMQDQFFKSLS